MFLFQEHFVCEGCHAKIMTESNPLCPVCRGELGNRRSLIAEKILCKLPLVSCKFVARCSFAKAEVAAVQRHEYICAHRLRTF